MRVVCVFVLGVAIAERLKPFKVKKFIYSDVAPRPELADAIQAEYGKPRLRMFVVLNWHFCDTGVRVCVCSVHGRVGQTVRFSGRVLCSDSGHSGHLQQEPFLQDEEHVRLHQHQQVRRAGKRRLTNLYHMNECVCVCVYWRGGYLK